ncbi:putative HTH-type transcriptional repressor ExuR [compost metagenome]
MKAAEQTVARFDGVELTEIEGNFNKDAGEQAAERILREYASPVAVFCLNDEMAIGLCNAVKRTNYVIGRDIHVIGFDNIELAEYTVPRLATIDYSKRKWGALASEQLLKVLAGEPVEHERVYVTLVQGDSVGEA